MQVWRLTTLGKEHCSWGSTSEEPWKTSSSIYRKKSLKIKNNMVETTQDVPLSAAVYKGLKGPRCLHLLERKSVKLWPQSVNLLSREEQMFFIGMVHLMKYSPTLPTSFHCHQLVRQPASTLSSRGFGLTSCCDHYQYLKKHATKLLREQSCTRTVVKSPWGYCFCSILS